MTAKSIEAVDCVVCLIATGKYLPYAERLCKAVYRMFVPQCQLQVCVFTDHNLDAACGNLRFHVDHEPWPGPTLHRYRTMLAAEEYLRLFDHIFYLDADMDIVSPVGPEILGPGLTATIHPGFANKARRHWPYETRQESRAYISPRDGSSNYYCGGFQGGRSVEYLQAMQDIAEAIEDDERRGITAVWHDESHWNRYLFDHIPAVVLPSTYCCPETWDMPGRKILALDKDHAAMRAST